MARPALRSAVLASEICTALLEAFGTQWNAYRQLDRAFPLSERGVSPSTFARALRGQTVTPEQADAIVSAWERRRVQAVAA
jgi:hypothetical protein